MWSLAAYQADQTIHLVLSDIFTYQKYIWQHLFYKDVFFLKFLLSSLNTIDYLATILSGSEGQEVHHTSLGVYAAELNLKSMSSVLKSQGFLILKSFRNARRC